MIGFKTGIALTACAAALAAATPANALNIVLDADSSFLDSPNGAAALLGFQKAANYWNKTITTDVTLRFDVHFDHLGDGILGGTYSNGQDTATKLVYQQLAATKSSALDNIAVANLRPLTAAGGLGMRVPGSQGGYISTAPGSVYDNNDSYNNLNLFTNTAVAKGLGIGVDSSNSLFQFYNDNFGTSFNVKSDADITFSSDFAFDFDPTNGIDTGAYDFVGVAIHEMGHALGFVSGTDDYDFAALPGGPGAPLSVADAENTAYATTLDLFRYAINGFAPDGSRTLQLDPNREAFFSIDADRPFNFNNNAEATDSFFATGEYNGDGSQASHWKDTLAILDPDGCFTDARQAGIMDPTASNCHNGIVTSNDLAAFDAMGWNIGIDILNNRGYTFDTAQAFLLPGLAELFAVPEAQTWMMMILGFGLVGGALRARRGDMARATA